MSTGKNHAWPILLLSILHKTLSPLQIMHRFMNATVSVLVIIRTSISLNPDLTLALIQLMAEKDDGRLHGFMSALQ